MDVPVAVFYQKRSYKRTHSKDEEEACCLRNFTEVDKEDCLSDFPREIVKQNQFVLNLLHQFGNGEATTENELNDVLFKIAGKSLCENCLCVLFGISDRRYERIKTFYQVGAKKVTHGNCFVHHSQSEQSLVAGAWLNNYLKTYSEPMPHADIFHLHVPSKKAVFNEKPMEASVSESSLYKLWNKKVKIPTKNQIFARCSLCQGIRKRCLEAGKCVSAIEALNEERRLHKELYMAEKHNYYNRQARSVDQPDELFCVIYDGMHKEKTKIPRFSKNPSKDLEAVPRIGCNLLGFICHRQGLNNNYRKQGVGMLNIGYQDNANFILSSLLHVFRSAAQRPFSRDLSCQFDNASNNKCNVAFGLFGYLISEEIFYNVYGNTLLVNHTHEDVDRMSENLNEHLRRADMVTPAGNVVMHYKRYTKDSWLPDSQDPTTGTYLAPEDRHGILLFKEIPHGTPELETPQFFTPKDELEKVKSSIKSLFKHPLMKDAKLEDRKTWWEEYLSGYAFKPSETTWPVTELKERRKEQNSLNESVAMSATEGLTYSEDEIPVVYSGPYLPPAEKAKRAIENVAINNGQWPVKKVLKERINQRTHKKEYMVEWRPSWVEEENLDIKIVQTWQKKKK